MWPSPSPTHPRRRRFGNGKRRVSSAPSLRPGGFEPPPSSSRRSGSSPPAGADPARHRREVDASEVATAHGCSEKLVVYRIKRMRLWRRTTSTRPDRTSKLGAGTRNQNTKSLGTHRRSARSSARSPKMRLFCQALARSFKPQDHVLKSTILDCNPLNVQLMFSRHGVAPDRARSSGYLLRPAKSPSQNRPASDPPWLFSRFHYSSRLPRRFRDEPCTVSSNRPSGTRMRLRCLHDVRSFINNDRSNTEQSSGTAIHVAPQGMSVWGTSPQESIV